MKVYKTTDKHPKYKAGLKIQQKESDPFLSIIFDANNKAIEDIGEAAMKQLIYDGAVSEVESQKYTNIDMLEFASYCGQAGNSSTSVIELLDNWSGKK